MSFRPKVSNNHCRSTNLTVLFLLLKIKPKFEVVMDLHLQKHGL